MYFITQVSVGLIMLLIAYLYFKHEYTWWEYILQLIFPLAIAGIVYQISTSVRETDFEFWGNTCVKVEWQDRYEYYDPCKDTEECNCTTDKDGNRSCSTCCVGGCVTVYPYGIAWNEFGSYEYISEVMFNEIRLKFGNKKTFEDYKGDGCGRGDMHRSIWEGEKHTYQAFITRHKYENKVRFQPIYNPKTATEEEIKSAYKYPPINGIDQDHILGTWRDGLALERADNILASHAGIYGPKSQEEHGQVKPFILIFTDQPKRMADVQRAAWQNGNKNEYTLMLGMDAQNENIKWFEIMTFSQNGAVKNRMMEFLHSDPKLNIDRIADEMSYILAEHWKRRSFTPLNNLITLKPNGWTWFLGILLNLLVGIGSLVAFSSNEAR